MLLEEFMRPMGLTQRDLAKAIRVPYQRINELVNGRRGMTPSTALRLAKYFGMSADFWLNLQLRWDLYHAQQSEAKELAVIQPYPVSAQAVGEGRGRAAQGAAPDCLQPTLPSGFRQQVSLGVRLHQIRSGLYLCLPGAPGRKKEIVMRLHTVGLIVMLALGILAVPLTAGAQPAGKVYR